MILTAVCRQLQSTKESARVALLQTVTVGLESSTASSAQSVTTSDESGSAAIRVVPFDLLEDSSMPTGRHHQVVEDRQCSIRSALLDYDTAA